jgi:hypothetical protein
MSITERAQKVLTEIDAALALADNAHGDAPPDYTYCPGLADYYEAASSRWPKSLLCLKTAIERLSLIERDPFHAGGQALTALTAICDTWEAGR